MARKGNLSVFSSCLRKNPVHFKGDAFFGGEDKGERPLWTMGDANAAAHAALKIHLVDAVDHRDGIELAEIGAFAAADAKILIRL